MGEPTNYLSYWCLLLSVIVLITGGRLTCPGTELWWLDSLDSSAILQSRHYLISLAIRRLVRRHKAYNTAVCSIYQLPVCLRYVRHGDRVAILADQNVTKWSSCKLLMKHLSVSVVVILQYWHVYIQLEFRRQLAVRSSRLSGLLMVFVEYIRLLISWYQPYLSIIRTINLVTVYREWCVAVIWGSFVILKWYLLAYLVGQFP